MNTALLETGSSEAVRTYLVAKFKKFNGAFYPKKVRRSKCMRYYIAASSANRKVVQSVYSFTFQETFPTHEADMLEVEMARKADKSHKISREDYLERKQDRIAEAELLLDQLKKWKKEQTYQEGESFYLQLKTAVGEYNAHLISPVEFTSEAEIKRVASLTGNVTRSDKEISAEFDAMLGIRQHAAVNFHADSPNWGEFKASLEQEFKAGVWAKGSAGAKMKKLGFSAEVQAALAIGMELNVDGNCTWKKDKLGLELNGNCNVFAGANASFGAQLGASAIKGLKASFDAQAFAGFSASVSGEAKFTYDDETLAGIKASASVLFGAGGQLSASIAAPIFGPAQISFTTSATLGLGMGVSADTHINFTNIYLAGAEQFRKVVYLPTLAKGYRMDLMTSDAKNLHYLNKCIARIDEDIESMTDQGASLQKVPTEKQALLMQMDDDD